MHFPAVREGFPLADLGMLIQKPGALRGTHSPAVVLQQLRDGDIGRIVFLHTLPDHDERSRRVRLWRGRRRQGEVLIPFDPRGEPPGPVRGGAAPPPPAGPGDPPPPPTA